MSTPHLAPTVKGRQSAGEVADSNVSQTFVTWLTRPFPRRLSAHSDRLRRTTYCFDGTALAADAPGMKQGDEVTRPEPDPRCDHDSRRVIGLSLPYGEASMVRARLVTEAGVPVEGSPLYSTDSGWAFTICRECATRGVLAQARILIADDVPAVLQLLRDALIEQGYDVHTATTGIEALNAVVTFQPDVILLDMQMPRLSGMKVLDELGRAGLTVPVILISAHPPKAREGIKKPFDLDTIARTVAAAVRQTRWT